LLTLTDEISDSVKGLEKSHKETAAVAIATSNSIHYLQESQSLALGAIEDLNHSVTIGIEKVPEEMSRVVEHTVRKLLEQHLARMLEETRRTNFEQNSNGEIGESSAAQDLNRRLAIGARNIPLRIILSLRKRLANP
jgi:hypothetical protein